MRKEQVNLFVADYETIKCRTCKYSIISGTMSISCCKFKIKPRNVYYESADCKEYCERISMVNKEG